MFRNTWSFFAFTAASTALALTTDARGGTLTFLTEPAGLSDALVGEVVDLTVVGSEDWVVFGDGEPSSNFNSGAPSPGTLVATNSRVGGTAINETLTLNSSLQSTLVDLSPFTEGAVLFDTDGNGSGDDQGGVSMRRNDSPAGGLVTWGVDDTIELTVEASPLLRVLSLWVLVNSSPTEPVVTLTLDVALGDGSADAITSSAFDDAGGTGDRVYLFEIEYAADTDTTLTATIGGADSFDTITTGDSAGILAAATLVVPEPASLTLLGLGGLLLARRRADRS